jgi:hypothetical protein
VKKYAVTYALLLLFFIPLVACGAPVTMNPPSPDTAVSPLQMVVATDDFAVGRSRVPFVLYAGPERVADARQINITAFDLAEETPKAVWRGEAVNYSDYEVPYWVVYPDFPQAGFWGIGAEIVLADGTVTQGQFAIEVKEQSSAPAIGSRPPASQNRTLATEPDIRGLTSDFDEPEPALYQMTVAEIVAAGRPAVITFSTPAFCASKLCAPVLSSVKEVRRQWQDQVHFLHLEIYQEFEPLLIAEEVTQWNLTSEPWTFVLDSDGRIAAKFGGPVSAREITAALSVLLP